MPGFDGTGPLGWGAGTGRGFGLCRGFRPRWWGFRGGGFRGHGEGWGAGVGPACWWGGWPGPSYGSGLVGPDDEKAFLKDQADQLKAELEEMEKRLAELEQGQ